MVHKLPCCLSNSIRNVTSRNKRDAFLLSCSCPCDIIWPRCSCDSRWENMSSSRPQNIGSNCWNLVHDLETSCWNISIDQNNSILCEEELKCIKGIWSKNNIHVIRVTSWCCCSICHSNVSITVVVVVHEMNSISSSFSSSLWILSQTICLN